MLLPPRYDLTFSYWIFAWIILYFVKVVPYNPKIWILIALIHNFLTLMTMIYYQNSLFYLFLYTFLNFFIKLAPLWLLHKTSMKEDDFWFGLGIFAIYLYWLHINKTNYWKYMKDGLQRIKQNKPVGPTEYYITKMLPKSIKPSSVRFS
jgi:hypothetical protein